MLLKLLEKQIYDKRFSSILRRILKHKLNDAKKLNNLNYYSKNLTYLWVVKFNLNS